MKKMMIAVGLMFMSFSTMAGSAAELTMFLSNKYIEVQAIYFNGRELPVEECNKDDVTFMHANGTYTYTANTPCSDIDDEDETGRWRVYNQSGKIFMETVSPDEVSVLTVQSYTSKQVVVQETFEEDGMEFEFKMILKIK